MDVTIRTITREAAPGENPFELERPVQVKSTFDHTLEIEITGTPEQIREQLEKMVLYRNEDEVRAAANVKLQELQAERFA